MKYPLCYFGNPLLREKSLPIEKITPEIEEFVQNMIETMEAHNGIGLAAPQVGQLLRVFIIRTEFIDENGEFQKGNTKVFINPKLSNPSEELEIMNEGCLSIPKVFVDVPRPRSIHVEALDEKGNVFSETFHDFTARQIMHENDHLNGTLIIDRCPPSQKNEAKPLLTALKKQFKQKS